MNPIILIDKTLKDKNLKFHIHRLLLEIPRDRYKINFSIKQGPTQKDLKFNINFEEHPEIESERKIIKIL